MRLVELRAGTQLEELRDTPWLLPLRHFSATSLKMALTCPEQYRQRYILGKKERPGAGAIQGSADHAAHEYNFAQKIASGVDLPTTEVVDRYQHAWEFELETRGDQVDWRGQKPDEIRAHGEKMVTLYREEVAPRIQPVAVEWEFELPLETVPIPLYGKLDLLAGDQGDLTPERIIERKTSARTEKKPKAAWKLQGELYQMVAAAELKVALPIEWHVVTKLKTPTVLTPLTPDTQLYRPFSGIAAENMRKLVEKQAWVLNAYYAKFGPDEPWPGEGIVHDWACSFCGFQKACVWVAR